MLLYTKIQIKIKNKNHNINLKMDNFVLKNKSLKNVPKFLNNTTHGYNHKTNSWHCLLCGVDIGINNPRQLYAKTFCSNKIY